MNWVAQHLCPCHRTHSCTRRRSEAQHSIPLDHNNTTNNAIPLAENSNSTGKEKTEPGHQSTKPFSFFRPSAIRTTASNTVSERANILSRPLLTGYNSDEEDEQEEGAEMEVPLPTIHTAGLGLHQGEGERTDSPNINDHDNPNDVIHNVRDNTAAQEMRRESYGTEVGHKRIQPDPLEIQHSTTDPNPNVARTFKSEAFGRTIDEHHSNFVLMYDMLTGIRAGVRHLTIFSFFFLLST